MNVIKRKTLQAFWERPGQGASRVPLLEWFKIARKARWHNFADIRRVRGDADVARVKSGRTAVVFDIGGNKYRLITMIDYLRQTIRVTHVLTHKQYDTNRWKVEL
jgi:mRNA interferase HigB